MVRLGVVALDGTKMAANAADRANRTLAKLQEEVTQILREAAETDQAEDRDGRARGADLPRICDKCRDLCLEILAKTSPA